MATTAKVQIAEGARLHGRFALVRKLGAGAQGQTWLATDQQSGQRVAVKIVSLRAAESWKAIELWEREVAILRQLDHPAIPAYRDAFQAESVDGDRLFCLVQDFVEGQSLATRLTSGPPLTEAAIVDLARQALQVLAYLHDLQPPVVHRDIKPSNLLQRPDGRLALIDFGAVQVQLPSGPEGGSTIVGTHGYMPGEQLMGRAVPASDLYALAATLVHLATRRPPADLPTVRMRLNFEDAAHLSPRLEAWLGQLLAPIPEDRPATARDALALLEKALRPVAVSTPSSRRVGGLRPFLRKHGALLLGLALIAGLVVAANRRGTRAPKALTLASGKTPVGDEACTLQVVPGDGFTGLAFEPVSCRTAAPSASYRYLRVVYRVRNQTDLALKELHAQVNLLDDSGKVVGGEPHHFAGGMVTIPLEPGESRLVGYTNWKPPAEARAVRYELRGPANLGKPNRQPRVLLQMEYVVPLPQGAKLELAQRFLQNSFGTRVVLELRNTGNVALKDVEVEVSFVDAQGQVVERKPARFVDSAVSSLPPGELGVAQVTIAKEVASVRYALVRVAAFR